MTMQIAIGQMFEAYISIRKYQQNVFIQNKLFCGGFIFYLSKFWCRVKTVDYSMSLATDGLTRQFINGFDPLPKFFGKDIFLFICRQNFLTVINFDFLDFKIFCSANYRLKSLFLCQLGSIKQIFSLQNFLTRTFSLFLPVKIF